MPRWSRSPSEMMAMEEEEGEGEVAALLHHYLNMVEVMIIFL